MRPVVVGVDGDAGADPLAQHRVIAFVATHEGFEPDGARGAARDLISVEAGARGERLGEQPLARARPGRAVDVDVGDIAEPVAALSVEIVEATKGAAVEKPIAQVGAAALDLALCFGALRLAVFDLEAMMAGATRKRALMRSGPTTT